MELSIYGVSGTKTSPSGSQVLPENPFAKRLDSPLTATRYHAGVRGGEEEEEEEEEKNDISSRDGS